MDWINFTLIGGSEKLAKSRDIREFKGCAFRRGGIANRELGDATTQETFNC